VATPIVAGFKTDQISVTNTGPGQFTIYVLDPLPARARSSTTRSP
jgi:hypothetical protein